MPMADRQHHTFHIHGIELHTALWGDGEPLVLLHGFTGTGADWAHVFDLDALAREHRLIIPDLRGHGGSTTGPLPITLRQSGLDVLALLDRLGIARCKAVGLSFGAKTLLHLATHAPERVEAMVLVSATTHFPEQARELMRKAAVEAPTEEDLRSMRARHRRGDEQIRALLRQPRSFAESVDDMAFTPSLLSTVRARTLIVHGDRDPLYPVEIAVELYRGIQRSALWIMPGEGHGPIFGASRDAFARTALEWLRGEAEAPIAAS